MTDSATMIDRRLFVASAAALAAAPSLAASRPALSIVELRQYTLKGGAREAFTRLFHQQFLATQVAAGSYVLGVFRDLDDPDRFVWMRGFASMAARKVALESFYYGPAWKAHRDEANAMIVDSDNVLLLRPLSGTIQPDILGVSGVARIAIHRLRDIDPAAFSAFVDARLRPQAAAAGARIELTLTSELAANTFPRLPVRENDPVFISVCRFRGLEQERAFDERLAAASGWRDGIADALLPALMQKPQRLRLAPSLRVA